MSEKKNIILVVEDENSLSEVLEDKFEKEGYKVIIAKDGAEGLKKSLEEHPDLILLDIIMPKMDGMTMLSKLREDKWGKEVPVILLTNLSDQHKIDEGTKDGVYDYLIKAEWKLEDVVEKVKEKLA